MITRITDRFISNDDGFKTLYAGLSTDAKPADAHNADEYLAVDTGKRYMYDAEGETWHEIATSKGETGATGNGIASVAKTSTSGLVDTYTITFTNGQTTTFEVTNGEDGSVAPSAIASDYSSSATYAVGDYVWYEGDLYRCVSEISTAEAWTSGHWTQVALADEVAALDLGLSVVNGVINITYEVA